MRLSLSLGKTEIASDLVVRSRVLVALRVSLVKIAEQGRVRPYGNRGADPSLNPARNAVSDNPVEQPNKVSPDPFDVLTAPHSGRHPSHCSTKGPKSLGRRRSERSFGPANRVSSRGTSGACRRPAQ